MYIHWGQFGLKCTNRNRLQMYVHWGSEHIEATCTLMSWARWGCVHIEAMCKLRLHANWGCMQIEAAHKLRLHANWGRTCTLRARAHWGHAHIEAGHAHWGCVQIEAACKLRLLCTLRPCMYIEADSIHFEADLYIWGRFCTFEAENIWGTICTFEAENIWGRFCTFEAENIWGRFCTYEANLYIEADLASMYKSASNVHTLRQNRPQCTNWPQMYIYWGQFLASNVQNLPQMFSASNVQLSDWLRHITWENNLSLPQCMYIEANLYIHWGWLASMYESASMYSSLIGSDCLNVQNWPQCTYIEAKIWKFITFDSNSTSDRDIRCAKTYHQQNCWVIKHIEHLLKNCHTLNPVLIWLVHQRDWWGAWPKSSCNFVMPSTTLSDVLSCERLGMLRTSSMSKTNRLTIAEQYNPIQHFYSPLLTVFHYMTRLIQLVVFHIWDIS